MSTPAVGTPDDLPTRRKSSASIKPATPSDSTGRSQTSPLLVKLPAELRNQIYTLVLTPRPSTNARSHDLLETRPVNNYQILLTCHQAFNEAYGMYLKSRQVYFRTTAFHLNLDWECNYNDIYHTLSYLEDSATDLACVQNLTITQAHAHFGAHPGAVTSIGKLRFVLVDKKGVWAEQHNYHGWFEDAGYRTVLRKGQGELANDFHRTIGEALALVAILPCANYRKEVVPLLEQMRELLVPGGWRGRRRRRVTGREVRAYGGGGLWGRLLELVLR